MRSVEYWLKTTFSVINHSLGSALWTVFINRDVYTPDGDLIRGSFRWWGGVIADVVGLGEDYLDYYCDYAPDDICDKVTDALLKAGWRLEYEAKICPICKKPIERGEMVAHDFKTGITTHALCVVKVEE